MAHVVLKNINKIYPNGIHAVHDFNIEITDGEFIAFVGPSGCGKSTTLRMVAGLEEITQGELTLNERLINDVAPKDRDIAMVFQSYALYPHMTAYQNMAFSLMIRRYPDDEIHEKVMEAAEILSLKDILLRKPKELSGGQRQRVALGRAIVRNPKVFLMDEPLSNLDAKLRVQMRTELIKLHRDLEATTIYVTHDQIEAMTMADRIVVMSTGYVQQIGSPKQVYNFPDNKFVAGFIGTPPMNFLDGTVKNGSFIAGEHSLGLPEHIWENLRSLGYDGEEMTLGIRPENIHYDDDLFKKNKNATIEIKIEVAELLGKETILHTYINNHKILANIDSKYDVESDQLIKIAFDMEKVHFFDNETEERVKY